MRILLVEDEADLRTDIAEELQAAGYEVAEAGEGLAALEAIEAATPDLVLCDISMPGMSGFEVMQLMRERNPDLADVPFIFLSALADRTDVIAGKRAGADDYLTKPIDFDLMLATIEARLGQVARMRDRAAAEAEQTRQALLALARREAQTAFEQAMEVLNRLAIGIFLITADHKVAFANEAGHELARSADGVLIAPNGLRAASHGETNRLYQLIDTALRASGDGSSGVEGELRGSAGGAMSLSRSSGQSSLAVLVLPLQGQQLRNAERCSTAIVFVTDPERQSGIDQDSLARLYGLTKKEAALAALLAQGRDLTEAADRLGMSKGTARVHLKRIFDKTGTHRQAELMILILRSVGIFDSGSPMEG